MGPVDSAGRAGGERADEVGFARQSVDGDRSGAAVHDHRIRREPLLGVGRPLNWKYSLAEILAAYPALIAGGFVGLMLLLAWAQYRASGDQQAFEGTRFVGAH